MLIALVVLLGGAAGAVMPAAAKGPVKVTTMSPNVKHIANYPTGVGVGGKFAGGYYFHTTASSGVQDTTPGSEYFRPTTLPVGGLHVLDVSVPEQPLPAAFLPISIWQNEDVDLSWERKILLISKDASRESGGTLYVIDITIPRAPLLRGILNFPQKVVGADNRLVWGPGHTASCILDCQFAYVAGSDDGAVHIVDLRNPNAPAVWGKVDTPAAYGTGTPGRGSVHDVHTDAKGNVWMMGTGGTAMYAPIKDPTRPQLLATVGPDWRALGAPFHHGALRLDDDTVLVTEENFGKAGCGVGGSAFAQDGALQTWKINTGAKQLNIIDEWEIALPHTGADKQTCSSHWFDVNTHRTVADAWYEGGTRFFDLSNPKDIRPIGFFTPEGAMAGQAQFFPGRPDLVYVSDYARGLDIISITGGGKGAPTVRPTMNPPKPVIGRRDYIVNQLSCKITL